MEDKWQIFEKKGYKPELVSLVKRYVDTAEYYYYKARCAKTPVETLNINTLSHHKCERIYEKIERVAPTSEDMPLDLFHEISVASGLTHVNIRDLGELINNMPELELRSAIKVRHNVTAKDFEILEQLKKKYISTYGEEP